MALVKLTKTEDQPPLRVAVGQFEVGPHKERTDRYFFEIEQLAEAISKMIENNML